jgi:hypothetical protein
MKNKKASKYPKLQLLLLLFIPAISFAMEEELKEDEDLYKIRFAIQLIPVRTSGMNHVWSTWEKAITNQGLAEKSVENNCKIDTRGMCCSHAVTNALEYCHGRGDLLASYLHKAVTGSYEEGMDLEAAMKFASKKGIMGLPSGESIKHGSGLSWPKGKRYKFSRVHNADSFSPSPFLEFSYQDKSQRYKFFLLIYNHPVIVSILSGYKGYTEKSPFLKYKGKDQDDILKEVTTIKGDDENDVPADAERLYHAIILYGFRNSTKRFLVKNSWGPEGANGLCTLPFEYIDKYASSAFVGMGHNNWEGDDPEWPAKEKRQREILKEYPVSRILVEHATK